LVYSYSLITFGHMALINIYWDITAARQRPKNKADMSRYWGYLVECTELVTRQTALGPFEVLWYLRMLSYEI
jgi:hypothetical protein